MDAMAKRGALAHARSAFFLLTAAWLAGCYGYGGYAQAQPDTPEVALDQAGRGEKIYSESCAGCHGERGEGSEGRPAFIGEKALPVKPPADASTRKADFNTAKDLFDFIKSDMPPIAPGSLADDDAWAIVAFQLKSSGVTPAGGDIGPKNAAETQLRR